MTFDLEEVEKYSLSSIQLSSKVPIGGSMNTDLHISYMRTGNSLKFTDWSRPKIVIKSWRAMGPSGGNEHTFKKILDTELRRWRKASAHSSISPILGQAPDIRALLYDDEESEYEPIPTIVIPYFRSGNAVDYLRINSNLDPGPTPILIGTADAILFLHTLKPPIVHTKIKGSNIMISDEGKPMLTDIEMGNLPSPLFGQSLDDVRWMPPEFIDLAPTIQSLPSTTASDVYSFAMTILELLTRSRPYANRKFGAQVIVDVYHGILPPRPSKCEDITDPIWDVLTQCWNRDAKQRPDVGVVLGILEISYFHKVIHQ